MGRRIANRTGAEFIYFTGAIGGLISTCAQTGEDGENLTDVESTIQTGCLLGDAACDIQDERVLPARLDIFTRELFPELAYGGALEIGAAGASADNPPTLAELMGGKDFIVLGLANDEIGYIVPPNDFLLDKSAPYIKGFKDAFGRDHYEETNSLGPQTAYYLVKALEKLLEDIQM